MIDTEEILSAHPQLILFDGHCVLCSGWVRMLLRVDKPAQFQFAAVTSPVGQALLAKLGLPLDRFDTFVLFMQKKPYYRSTAFLKIIGRLPWYFQILRIIWLLPLNWRDGLYNCIARNRYRIFGRRQHCLLPTSSTRERFVEA